MQPSQSIMVSSDTFTRPVLAQRLRSAGVTLEFSASLLLVLNQQIIDSFR